MSEKKSPYTYVTEQIFEIRYEPRGSFISHIGEIADYIHDKNIFVHWSIEANTIKFRDATVEPDKLHALLSFRNAGLVAISPETPNYFSDKACQYWKAIETNGFFNIPKISRIGVRNRCFVRTDKNFKEIEQAIFNSFFKPENFGDMGGTRKDLQIVLDFEDDKIKSRLTLGPIFKGQAKQLYNFKSDHFNHTGIFIDIDISIDNPNSSANTVSNFIRHSSTEGWKRVDSVLEKIGF